MKIYSGVLFKIMEKEKQNTGKEKFYFVYILECSDKTFYTGYTDNLENRLAKHNQGQGAKYTRGRLPVKILYSEEFASKSEALKREAVIKKMKREAKEKLIKNRK